MAALAVVIVVKTSIDIGYRSTKCRYRHWRRRLLKETCAAECLRICCESLADRGRNIDGDDKSLAQPIIEPKSIFRATLSPLVLGSSPPRLFRSSPMVSRPPP